ncbi:MAG: hypothetical protein EXR79_15105 [Myxococcales bacterium]|nr:hypothetical protein [Myxococcales bacterium]
MWDPDCFGHREPIADLLGHPLLKVGVDWAVDFVRPDGLFWPWGDALPAGVPFGALTGPLHHAGAAWGFAAHPFLSWTADLCVETLPTTPHTPAGCARRRTAARPHRPPWTNG